MGFFSRFRKGRPIVLEVRQMRLQGIDKICFVTTGILTGRAREQIKEQWEQCLSSKVFAAHENKLLILENGEMRPMSQTTNTSGKS